MRTKFSCGLMPSVTGGSQPPLSPAKPHIHTEPNGLARVRSTLWSSRLLIAELNIRMSGARRSGSVQPAR